MSSKPVFLRSESVPAGLPLPVFPGGILDQLCCPVEIGFRVLLSIKIAS